VFAALDPELFKSCFLAWIGGLRDDDPDIIAVDGKTSRRSHGAREGLIKAQVLRKPDQRHRDRDIAEAVAEAFRRAGLLPSHIEPETPFPDVPPHQRGFGVMDEDAPGDGDAG
jgi:hypothetical protein